MKIAFGILGVLLILAIVYYFLPQGIKTTFRGIFGGSNTTQIVKTSPTPAPSGTIAPAPTLVASARPSTTPAASGLLRSASPTPKASTSATPRSATQSAVKLPSTGIQNQPIEVTIIQILASALIVMIGVKLSRFV